MAGHSPSQARVAGLRKALLDDQGLGPVPAGGEFAHDLDVLDHLLAGELKPEADGVAVDHDPLVGSTSRSIGFVSCRLLACAVPVDQSAVAPAASAVVLVVAIWTMGTSSVTKDDRACYCSAKHIAAQHLRQYQFCAQK